MQGLVLNLKCSVIKAACAMQVLAKFAGCSTCFMESTEPPLHVFTCFSSGSKRVSISEQQQDPAHLFYMYARSSGGTAIHIDFVANVH